MRRRLLKTLTTLALSVLMIVSVISAFVLGIGADKPINAIAAEGDQTYTKVTSAPTDWSGTYLIVYENGNEGVAFDGSLGSLDAVSNTQSMTISNFTITGDFAKYTFIIEKVDGGYSIKSASEKFIGRSTNSNGLDSKDTAVVNTISLDGDGNVDIKSSGGAYLRYNATSGQTRFRYYKSSSYTSQKAITLYKLEENAGGSDPECAHTNTENREATDPTCTEQGYEAGVYCKDCRTYISGHKEINAWGHDEVNHEAKAATCTEVGWDAYVTCSRCDYTTYVEIPKIAHTYKNGVCTECGAEEPATATYALVTDVTDLTEGSQIIIAAVSETYKVALSTYQKNNNRGQASVTMNADDTITPSAEVQIITLEKGKNDNTFAFNVGNGYLYAASSSSNYLKTEKSLSNNSSWTISITDGVATITAQGVNTRNILRYNSGNSLFSCYSSGQKDVSIYKLVEDTESDSEPVLKGVALALNKGVTVQVKYVIPELWLNANAGAQVVFSNGQSFEAKAGENVYSVDLTPAQINDALTVKIQLADDTVFGAETDVSVSAYKTKVEAMDKDKLDKYDELIALLNAALTYSNAADGKDVTLKGSFAEDETTQTTIVHGKKDDNGNTADEDKLFIGYAGTLGTYASVKVTVNSANAAKDDILLIQFGKDENAHEIYCDFLKDRIVKDNITESEYIVIDEIYPLNFNDTIYIEASDGSNATFTFNAYLKDVYNGTSVQTVKNLALATYLYGLAAEAYNTAQ